MDVWGALGQVDGGGSGAGLAEQKSSQEVGEEVLEQKRNLKFARGVFFLKLLYGPFVLPG